MYEKHGRIDVDSVGQQGHFAHRLGRDQWLNRGPARSRDRLRRPGSAPRFVIGITQRGLHKKAVELRLGRRYVPTCSIEFCVAMTMKGVPTAYWTPVNGDVLFLHHLEE